MSNEKNENPMNIAFILNETSSKIMQVFQNTTDKKHTESTPIETSESSDPESSESTNATKRKFIGLKQFSSAKRITTTPEYSQPSLDESIGRPFDITTSNVSDLGSDNVFMIKYSSAKKKTKASRKSKENKTLTLLSQVIFSAIHWCEHIDRTKKDVVTTRSFLFYHDSNYKYHASKQTLNLIKGITILPVKGRDESYFKINDIKLFKESCEKHLRYSIAVSGIKILYDALIKNKNPDIQGNDIVVKLPPMKETVKGKIIITLEHYDEVECVNTRDGCDFKYKSSLDLLAIIETQLFLPSYIDELKKNQTISTVSTKITESPLLDKVPEVITVPSTPVDGPTAPSTPVDGPTAPSTPFAVLNIFNTQIIEKTGRTPNPVPK
jgi:hypothetical protein